MSLIPTYFCDNCGHAFNHPENRGKGWFNINGREHDDHDERCPRCGNPDYELLQPEPNEKDLAVA